MTGNRSKLKFAASVALIFFVGAVAGVLGASVYFEGKIEKMFHGKSAHGEKIIERLTRDLDLTPAQQAEIRPLVLAFDKKASDLKQQFRPQMKQLHDQVTDQIRTSLDETQKKKFDEINKKLEKRFRKKPPPSPPVEDPHNRPS
jgi:Spy/CpxP family protein refolding chaperone